MQKIVCCKCGLSMPIAKSGAWLIEFFMQPPQPYKIWHCDIRRCVRCGTRIVAGVAERAAAEHYEDGFDEFLQELLGDPNKNVVFNFERMAEHDDPHVMRFEVEARLKKEKV